MLAGLELVAGYLIAWAVAKARRVGRGLDEDTDLAIEAGLDRLHQVVVEKLGGDPALEKLERLASSGEEVGEITRRRVADAVAEAAHDDPEFAAELETLLGQLRDLPTVKVITATGQGSAAVGRDAHISAETGSAAALTMGEVNIGGPPAGPQEPGRPGG